MTFLSLKKDLQNLANPEKAKIYQRFFKTGKGEYGEGDVFLGIKVPVQRSVAKKYNDLSLKDVQAFLNSKIHEHRMVGLFILVDQFQRANDKKKKQIFDFYLRNAKQVNNWDLVDLSADKIVGEYLFDKGEKKKRILYKLAKSKNLWERRISIIATFAFIKRGESGFALNLYELFLKDKHDLIHKAVGWMLREIGKRVSQAEEKKFLKKHYKTMPRTMLRYAIERFDENKKKFYMKK